MDSSDVSLYYLYDKPVNVPQLEVKVIQKFWYDQHITARHILFRTWHFLDILLDKKNHEKWNQKKNIFQIKVICSLNKKFSLMKTFEIKINVKLKLVKFRLLFTISWSNRESNIYCLNTKLRENQYINLGSKDADRHTGIMVNIFNSY